MDYTYTGMTTTFNILIIDPDGLLYGIVQDSIVDMQSISLSVVSNGEEGYQIIKAGSFHALITGFSLTDIYAPEFTHLLKTSGIIIPHIILTDISGEDKVIQALNEGIRFYIKTIGNSFKNELTNRIKTLQASFMVEDTLRKSEEHYRYIADHASDIMAIRGDSTYFYLNPAGMKYCNIKEANEFEECLIYDENASHTPVGSVSAIRYLPAELHPRGQDSSNVQVAIVPIVYHRNEAEFIIICHSEKTGEPQSCTTEFIEELLNNITNNNADIRNKASDELAKIGKNAVQPLFEAMRSLSISDMFVKMSVEQTIAETLGKLGKDAIPDLSDAAQYDPDWNIRSAAIDALATIGDNDALGILAQSLELDEDWNVRAGAAEALGKLGDAGAIPYLKSAAADDSNDMVKIYAQEAISTIESKN